MEDLIKKSEVLIRKSDVLRILNEIGGCGAKDAFTKGWDEAINGAYREVEKLEPVIIEEDLIFLNKKIIIYLVGALVALFVLAAAVYVGRPLAACIEIVAAVNFIIKAIMEARK